MWDEKVAGVLLGTFADAISVEREKWILTAVGHIFRMYKRLHSSELLICFWHLSQFERGRASILD